MVEHNVTVPVGELFASGLHGAVQNLIHALDVAVGADDGGKVLQGALQRVIQAGHHQKEHKEGQNIQLTLHQQSCAGKGGGGNPEPQDKSRGNHKDSRSQLAPDEAALYGTDFLFQPRKVSLLGIVGAQIGHRFHAFLNAVLAGDLCRRCFAGELFLHVGGKQYDGKRHGQRPDGGKRHAPVEKQHRYGDDRGGEDRTVQRCDKMGLALLQHGAVVHDGSGQVGKVFPSEKGQRNFSQLLGKPHPAHTRLDIGDKKGVVVFQPCADNNEQCRRDTADHIKRNSPCRQRAVHDIAHQPVQKPHRQHEGDILQGTAQNPFDVVNRPLAGKRVASL